MLFAAITKSTGTLVHGRNKTVDWRVVGTLATGSIPATGTTLFVVSQIDVFRAGKSAVISTLLGAMLILTAISLLFRKHVLAMAADRVEVLGVRVE